jgi:hypothetical protein
MLLLFSSLALRALAPVDLSVPGRFFDAASKMSV